MTETEEDFISSSGSNIVINGFDKEGNPDKVVIILKAKNTPGELTLYRFSGFPVIGKEDKIDFLNFIAEGIDYIITNDGEYIIEAAKNSLNETAEKIDIPVEEKDKI